MFGTCVGADVEISHIQFLFEICHLMVVVDCSCTVRAAILDWNRVELELRLRIRSRPVLAKVRARDLVRRLGLAYHEDSR